MIGDY